MKKSICLFLFLILMLFHADYVTEGAKYGLLLWYSSVVPALFPFMVLSGLIVAGGGLSVLMKPFYFLLHPLLGLSAEGCYVLVAGLLCGYPMGAKTCADFMREGRIGAAEGRLLMAIANHPSPMFVLGFVYPFFKGQATLPRLLVSVYGPVFLIAAAATLIYRPVRSSAASPSAGVFSHSPDFAAKHPSPRAVSASSAPASADASILSAVELLCKIGGYLILFSIGIVFLRHAAFIPLSLRLPLVISMEMTTGIREAAASLAYPLSGAAACAALTFGGFSGIFQTRSVIADAKKAGLSIRPYCIWKLLHAGLAAGCFLL